MAREFTFKIHGLGTGTGLNCLIFCKQTLLQDTMILAILQNVFTYLTSKLVLFPDFIYLRTSDHIEHHFFKLKDLYSEWMDIRGYLDSPFVIIYSETDLRFHKKAQNYLRKDSGTIVAPFDPFSRRNILTRSSSLTSKKLSKPEESSKDILILNNESSEESLKSFEHKKGYLTKDIGTVPKNKANVFSSNSKRAPFSVLTLRELDTVLLSPVYMNPETLSQKFNQVEKKRLEEALWNFFKQASNGELILTNNIVLSAEKGILKEVISNRLSSMFGREANAGLPIRIFKPFSQLEAIGSLFCNLDFLHKATQVTSPLEKFQFVIAYAFANIAYGISPWKPFTPYLGETLQGKTADGSEIYLEHFGHKPFLDALLIVNSAANFRVSGTIESDSDEKANKIVVRFKGVVTVQLESTKFYFTLPSVANEGFSYKKRTLALEDGFCFYCPDHLLKALVRFGVNSIPNQAEGAIYPVQYPVEINGKQLDKLLFRNGKSESKETAVSVISGNWFESLKFDKVLLWDNSMEAYKLQMKKDVLPSDWRFREDILWLLYEQPDLALAWKLKLEETQRQFRELRYKHIYDKKKGGHHGH